MALINTFPVSNPDMDYSALNLLPSQVCILDENGMLVFVNESWLAFAQENGFKYEDFIGNSYLKICSCATGVEEIMASSFAKRLSDVLFNDGQDFSFIYPCHAPTRKRWFKGIVQKIPTGAFIMHVDISSEYEDFQKSSNILSSSKTIHDLRSPLNSIIGFSDLALDVNRSGAPAEKVVHYFNDISKSGHRMLEIVNDLLDYAAISQESVAGKEKTVDLNHLVAEILSEYRPLYLEKQIDVVISGSAPPILGGEQVLWKVFGNLLTNAIKYTEAGGRISVFLSQNDSGGVEVAVQDNGIGIAPHRITDMFIPFAGEGLEALTGDRSSSGIGLAIVRDGVEAHDGIIKAASAKGVGTLMTVIFPGWRTFER